MGATNPSDPRAEVEDNEAPQQVTPHSLPAGGHPNAACVWSYRHPVRSMPAENRRILRPWIVGRRYGLFARLTMSE